MGISRINCNVHTPLSSLNNLYANHYMCIPCCILLKLLIGAVQLCSAFLKKQRFKNSHIFFNGLELTRNALQICLFWKGTSIWQNKLWENFKYIIRLNTETQKNHLCHMKLYFACSNRMHIKHTAILEPEVLNSIDLCTN